MNIEQLGSLDELPEDAQVMHIELEGDEAASFDFMARVHRMAMQHVDILEIVQSNIEEDGSNPAAIETNRGHLAEAKEVLKMIDDVMSNSMKDLIKRGVPGIPDCLKKEGDSHD